MRRRNRFMGLLPFIFSLLPLGAADAGEIVSLIGLTPEEAFGRLGSPDRILSLRGESPGKDDVVFFYEDFCYLFWEDQRVWQVRFDENSRVTWRTIGSGSEIKKIRRVLGDPYFEAEDWDIFLISGQPWPLRLRVFYRRGMAIDFYLYRGDF